MTEKIETELTALRERAEKLRARHAAADAALLDAKANLQRHHLEAPDDADDKVRVKLEAQVAASVVTRNGYADALTDLQAKIADAERKLVDERSAAARKAASEKLTRDLDAVEQALPAYLEAGRKFADALDAIHHHYETAQMAAFIRSTSSQVEVAHAFATQELRGMVKAVAEGSAPIPAPKPTPAPVVVEQKPPTQTVFMLKSARFTDHDGRRKFAGQWTDQALPAPIAERALRHGIAVPTTHQMRATHLGMRGSDYVADGPDVLDLDQLSDSSGAVYEPPGAQNDAVISANFKRVDRGPAITGTIEVARVL
jgi:hypothetical protein